MNNHQSTISQLELNKVQLKNKWQTQVKTIILQCCSSYHTKASSIPNLTYFEVIKEVAKTGSAVDISNLIRISHIYLFSITFIFFFVDLIFSLATGFNKWLKALIIIAPFAFLLVDVNAWVNKKRSYVSVVSYYWGVFGYSLASTIMLSTSLYQMWIMSWRGQISHENAWSDGRIKG